MRAVTPTSERVVTFAVVAYAALIGGISWVGGDPFYNNDESRQLMTGAFWCDVLTEWPTDDPEGFAKRYFAQYPNLGLLVSPQLFHWMEGAAFRVFGVGPTPARVLLGLFTAGFLIGWWYWVRAYIGLAAATWTTLIVGLIPDLFELSGHVMLEIPFLAWMVASVLAFRRYLQTQRPAWLWAACSAATAVALTRFHAPIVLAPLAVELLAARRWGVLRRPMFWLPVFLATAVSGTYYFLNLSYYQTWHTLLASDGFGPPALLPGKILRSIGMAPALLTLVGLTALLVGPRARRAAPWPVVAWFLATVVMWFCMSYRPPRFLAYAWPAGVALGLGVVFLYAGQTGWRRAAHALAAVAFLATAWETYANYRPGLHGYARAADQAMAASQTGRLFIHGRQDGVFIWRVRQRDPDLRYAVFRASKTLSSGEPGGMKDYRPLLESAEAMLDQLEALGVDVVVSEDRPEIDSPPYHTFLRLLTTERFEPIGRVDLENAGGRIAARTLTVYRFRREQSVPGRVTLPLTALGPDFVLEADLSRPLRGWRDHAPNRSRTVVGGAASGTEGDSG
jgi:hypothetical protein